MADDDPITVDLDDLVDYGKRLFDQGTDLVTDVGRTKLLRTLPARAFPTAPMLPEAAFAMGTMLHNAAEMGRFLSSLGQALVNTGMAAQTISDAYSSTDGDVAVSLNSVLFAFADPAADRPSGLPAGFPITTYKEKEEQRRREAEAREPDDDVGTWVNQAPQQRPDGTTVFVAVNDVTGERRTVTQFTDPHSGAVITTVTDQKGIVTVSTSVSNRTGLFGKTTYTETRAGGPTGPIQQVTKSVEDPLKGSTTSRYDSTGKLTERVTDKPNGDGTWTNTTTEYDKGKPRATQQYDTPTHTQGPSSADPYQETVEELRAKGWW